MTPAEALIFLRAQVAFIPAKNEARAKEAIAVLSDLEQQNTQCWSLANRRLNQVDVLREQNDKDRAAFNETFAQLQRQHDERIQILESDIDKWKAEAQGLLDAWRKRNRDADVAEQRVLYLSQRIKELVCM